jgi:acetylornithine/N-succinyldiaminopimelate aminotransferase
MNTDHDSYLMSTTARPAAVMVRGEGSYLWDASGRRYLDFIQGWAVNALGHASPEVHGALVDQSARLVTPSPALHNAPQLALARRLVAESSMARAVFCSTGAEANEGAIKLARKWGRKNRKEAFEIITTHGAFHGRTLTAMAASGKPGWDALFPPVMPGFVKVPYGDVAAIADAMTKHTAAILVEPIQGEGGVIVPPDGYLKELRALADERGLLLVLDEIQTGMGRTGTLFACQREGVIPDIMTLGKGLGAGVPLAAVLTSERAGTFAHGEHGGTYNGNALMTAVGLRVLDTVVRPAFLEHVGNAGAYLREGLERSLPVEHVAGVRGRGLLVAVELERPLADRVRDRAFEGGLLVNAARPTTLRLMPSLRVSFAEIDEMVAMLGDAIGSVTSEGS